MDILEPPARTRVAPLGVLVAVILGGIVLVGAAVLGGLALATAMQRRHPHSLSLSLPVRALTVGGGGGGGGTDVDCSVSYSVSTPCEGDCWDAWQFYTGTVVVPPAGNGAPCPPLLISISCAGEMPCLCKGADLPLPAAASVTTCNDCALMVNGETCYVACQQPGMTMLGTPALTCANGTWAYAGLAPTCNAAIAQCPPVMNVGAGTCANNGVIVAPGSVCIGAGPGDVCSISCMAGFAVDAGDAWVATCTGGSWTDAAGNPATLACTSQANCVATSGNTSGGTGDTCAAGSADCASFYGAATHFAPPARGTLLRSRR